MPHANVNDIQLYYEVHGKGPTLFLLQGFTRNLLTLMPLVERLQNSYQLVLLDHRGSGRSDHPNAPYTISQMASDISKLMDILSIKKAHFFGHSMGGAIVEQVAITFPEKVDKIVLCSSFAKVPYPALMQIDIISQMAIAGVPIEFILQTVLPWQFSSQCLEIKGMPENIIKKVLSDPYPQKTEGYLGQGEALKNFNIIDKLDTIKSPCLILVGEEDLYTPVPCSRMIQEKIKMAQMKVIPHQGHMVNEEMPDLICDEIKAFTLP